jgi:hypothetical protein
MRINILILKLPNVELVFAAVLGLMLTSCTLGRRGTNFPTATPTPEPSASESPDAGGEAQPKPKSGGKISATWVHLEKDATRFPYYEGEEEPFLKDERACHDAKAAYSEKTAYRTYVIAVSDTAASKILWDPKLGRCWCQGSKTPCPGPSCPQQMCGRKVLIRCSADSPNCSAKFMPKGGKAMVAVIRDVCPKDHERNVKAGHCQSGNHIDIYREMFKKMAVDASTNGENLRVDFAALEDQSVEPGEVEVTTP